MKTITLKWGEAHITHCDICFQMTRRGYRSEDRYWDDFFSKSHKLKPVKYRVVKGWGKDKGKEIKYTS
jgi:hypothetical protein